MNRRRNFVAFAVAILLPLFASSTSAQNMERVSLSTDGVESNDFSLNATASADGAVVAFYSGADNLVAGDTNGEPDIFVHIRRTGVTERVSVATGGGQANARSMNPAVSADGNVVAFFSFASNLVEEDTNDRPDIFVHDRRTGVTERVSVATGGGQANAASLSPAISADGNVVAFQSIATNLVPRDTNYTVDVFVHDRNMGVTERVSITSTGAQANSFSQNPAINADGTVVAFRSFADNLVPGDSNGLFDVFVYDRKAGVTERISVASDGAEGNGGSFNPHLTADGAVVAFRSYADNLVERDTNGTWDAFVHNRRKKVTERVSVGTNGAEGDDASELHALSADGRFVAFQSDSSNLVAGYKNGKGEIFLHDRTTGTTKRIAAVGSISGELRTLSADGNVVVLQSLATNLVAADTNGTWDIFVYERTSGKTNRVSVATDDVGKIDNVTKPKRSRVTRPQE